MKRVVITGLGTISSSGKNPTALWERLVAGKHGFVPIKAFDTSNFDVKYAAEIQDWSPEEFGISKKEARRMDVFTQYAMAAANQALEQAGDVKEKTDPFRFGVIVGSGIGGFHTIEQEYQRYMEKGPDRVSVFMIPMMISNMAGGMIAINHGLKGENYAPVSACSASNHAIGEAFRKIRHGYLDACVAGGSEACITEFAMGGFNNMGALSRGTNPDRISIPFDEERAGFVMGDGSSMLILEEYQHAINRGATIYGEIVGYGATDDAYHITSPDPNGEGPGMAMKRAVEDAGISLEQIDYINAHGTSTELNDKYETNAIKLIFGEHAKKIAISSTKSMTGHLLGAAGATEAVITTLALKNSTLPPTANYLVYDPECDLDYITEGARPSDAEYALSNSFGFGGHNASIILKKYTD